MDILDLLPDSVPLTLNTLRLGQATLSLSLTTTAPASPCPSCGQLSHRIHSRYRRCLSDLPFGGIAVHIEIRARKFFCDNACCDHIIFSEPLPGLAARYAHKTLRLQSALQIIGFAIGGEAGARVAHDLAMNTSADTLLRLIRQWRPAPSLSDQGLRVLGVDDWAKRRGHNYGTVLVNLEARKLIDLLPDRTAESFAQWLREHPGVKIISRDRGGSYAQGARQGAPDAIQVADRWHLLKNLGEALERFLLSQHKVLREVAELSGPLPPPELPSAEIPASEPPTQESETMLATPENLLSQMNPTGSQAQQLSAERRERRLARYHQVQELWRQQYTIQEIARCASLDEKTVRRYLRSDGFLERATSTQRRCALTPYQSHLRQRWDSGEHDATVLWRELQARGYDGNVRGVQRAVVSWRPADEQRRLARTKSTGLRGISCVEKPKAPSARQIIGVLVGCVRKPEINVQTFVDKLVEVSPAVRTAGELGQEFYRIVKTRDEPQLDVWLHDIKERGPQELRAFAKGLLQDEAAVRNGLSLAWSNGQTEGQVNKIKTLKRQMYGRANFDLLRQRLLKAA